MEAKENLTILIVNATNTPTGGIVNAAMAYAVGLRELGHTVIFMTSTPPQESRRLVEAGVELLIDKAVTHPLAAILKLRNIKYRRLVTQRKVSAIIHQGSKSYFQFLLCPANIPQFVAFHNYKVGGRKRFKNWIALTDNARNELIGFCKKHWLQRNIFTVPNAFLPWRLTPSIHDSPARHDAKLVLGCLSVLTPRKGIDLVIKAISMLRAQDIEVALIIAGDGEEKNNLMKLAESLSVEDLVNFWGWTNDLEHFFCSIDVFCLTSYNEPFGIGILEAMANGKAVIATRTDGANSIIADGGNGLLVDQGNEVQVAEAIRNLYASRELLAKISQAAATSVQEKFSTRAVGKIVEDIVIKAIGQSNR